MPDALLIDGEARVALDPLDRGFAYGDGIFRTVRVRAGRLLNWRCHLSRLAADCSALGLAMPEARLLADEARRVAPGDGVVKITITRGASARGYAPGPGTRGRRIVAAFPAPDDPSKCARDGVRVRRCDLVLSEQPRLAGVKSLNRLENVLARAEWSDPEIREGLLFDGARRLVGGTASNVFLVRAGTIATPGLGRSGVAGAQRERVLGIAHREGIGIEVRDVQAEEVDGADEVFLSNSLIGIWPVIACGELRWMPGPLARRLQNLIARDDEAA